MARIFNILNYPETASSTEGKWYEITLESRRKGPGLGERKGDKLE